MTTPASALSTVAPDSPEAVDAHGAQPPAVRVLLGARDLVESLNALRVREVVRRVQEAAAAGKRPAPLAAAAEVSAVGLRLRSDDGRAVLTVPASAPGTTAGARHGEAHYTVDVDTFAAAVQQLVGATPADGVHILLAAEDDDLAVERADEIVRGGREVVADALCDRALAGGLRTDTMPLALAWATRAAVLGDTAATDAALGCALQRVNDGAESRAYEMWRSEMPQWTLAMRGVLARRDDAEREDLAAVALDRLAASPDVARELDQLACLTLAAGLLDRRAAYQMAVVAGVPVTALRRVLAPEEPAPTDLLPSAEARATALATLPAVRALSGPLLAATRGETADYLAALDANTAWVGADNTHWVEKLGAGKVREANRSYADRLASVPLPVLAAAMLAQDHADATDTHARLTPDAGRLASALAERWAEIAPPVSGELLAAVAREADDRLSLSEGVRQQRERAEERRVASARAKRSAVVSEYLPSEEDEVLTRIALGTGAPRVGRVAAQTTATAQHPVLLPPPAVAGFAVERGVMVVVHVPSSTALVEAPEALVVWNGKAGSVDRAVDLAQPRYVAEAARAILATARPDGLFNGALALTGDELLFAHAVANRATRGRAGQTPCEGLALRAEQHGGDIVLPLGEGAALRVPLTRGRDGALAMASAREALEALAQTPQTMTPGDFGFTSPGLTFRMPLAVSRDMERTAVNAIVTRSASTKLERLSDAVVRGRALRERVVTDEAEEALRVTLRSRASETTDTELLLDPETGAVSVTSAGPRGTDRADAIPAQPGTTSCGPVRTRVSPAGLSDALEVVRAGCLAASDARLQPTLTGAPLVLYRERLAVVLPAPRRVECRQEARDTATAPTTVRALAARVTG